MRHGAVRAPAGPSARPVRAPVNTLSLASNNSAPGGRVRPGMRAPGGTCESEWILPFRGRDTVAYVRRPRPRDPTRVRPMKWTSSRRSDTSTRESARRTGRAVRSAPWLRFDDEATWSAQWRPRVLLARAITTVYRRMLVLTYTLERRRIPVYQPGTGFTVRLLGDGDVPVYCRFRGASATAMRERLARGHHCVATWYGDAIVDAGWMACGAVDVPYLGCRLLLDPGDIYHYDAYTAPAFRGAWLFMVRNSIEARWAQEHGYTRSVAAVAAENYRSWLVLTRVGLETRGMYHSLRLGPWRRDWQQSVDGAPLPVLDVSHSLPRGRTALPVCP